MAGAASFMVLSPPPKAALWPEGPAGALLPGMSALFQAQVFDANGVLITGAAVTWDSSNTNVAVIQSNGLLLGLSQGSTTISAKSGAASATLTVTVGYGRASTPSAAAIGKLNGTLNVSASPILKGFDPVNPSLGDAIVATFFWLGSSNIITSVKDDLSDATAVGNTYTLVDYVTLGGLSMATYLAVNAQNFPPKAVTPKVLRVSAILSSGFADGGCVISTFSGIHTVYASALGQKKSASGNGAGTQVADPGAIVAGPGALIYAVTASDGVVGLGTPTGFTQILQQSDASMKADAEYKLLGAAGATVDPQWSWFFGGAQNWLATVMALNPLP
jgi:hypothetical protein